MSKYLDKVIEEMGNYGDIGLPDGEGATGMGSVSTLALRGGNQGKAIKAYKLNDVLRHRNSAEEEELNGMGDNEQDDMGANIEELKQFFMDNPEPSDEEIAMYAEEKDMDLQEMRKAVYALIQQLLPEDDIDDEGMDDMDNEQDIDFSVSGDTGERPARNEIDSRKRF